VDGFKNHFQLIAAARLQFAGHRNRGAETLLSV
jgi:hypothetical protein